MFARRFFPDRFYAPRYWAKAGIEPEPHTVEAFAVYRSSVGGFGMYRDRVEAFGVFDAAVEALAEGDS